MTESDQHRRREGSPASLVTAYRDDFATVLPSHIKPDTWVRLAVGALRRDKNLAQAAQANPGSLMVALLDAARKGLEPGTESTT
jgi:recombination protein RecT